MNTILETIAAFDGTLLRVGRFEPDTAPLGVIQVIHGFGEHIGRYESTAQFFADRGYCFVVHEQRGFGIMPGKTKREREKARGITPGYAAFFPDIQLVRENIAHWYPDLPVFLYGHSMGGNIAVNLFLRFPEAEEAYEKLILEAPWFRLYRPLSPFMHGLALFLGKISPKLTTSGNLRTDDISRDKEDMGNLLKDEIFHNTMSLRLYGEIAEAGERAIQEAAKLPLPTLLLNAGEDKIVSPRAIREFSENAASHVELVEYPEGYHCLHCDVIKDQVLDRILTFCNMERACIK